SVFPEFCIVHARCYRTIYVQGKLSYYLAANWELVLALSSLKQLMQSEEGVKQQPSNRTQPSTLPCEPQAKAFNNNSQHYQQLEKNPVYFSVVHIRILRLTVH